MEGGLGETQGGRIDGKVGEEGAEDSHICWGEWGRFREKELGDIILSFGGAEGVSKGG